MIARRKQSPTFAGLFSGCGGFDLGFEQAGFESIASFDIDEQAIENYNLNLDGTSTACDLSSISTLGLKQRPDVVIAGPPCQGFSTLGRRSQSDPRNSLLVHAAKLAVAAKPRVILLENVSGAIAGEHKSFWNNARQHFQTAGYKTKEFQINGTDFGLPQIRKRIILMAAKKSLEKIQSPKNSGTVPLTSFLVDLNDLSNHEPIKLAKGTPEFRIAQKILPHQKLCNVRGGDRSVATWDIPDVFGKVTKDELKLLKIIQKLRRQHRIRTYGDSDPLTIKELNSAFQSNTLELIRALQDKGYLRKIGKRFDLTGTFNGKYRRLSLDHPSPTVDTRFGQPRYFLHPVEHRGMSAREAARIQGFPDSYTFVGSLTTQFRIIGNAVAPPIGQWFANIIQEQLL